MEDKFDFMYNHLDYDSDRSVVRAKFMNEVNKRTTLEDIGETLDKLTIAAKAYNYKYYDVAEHHDKQPKRAEKDFTSDDWAADLLGCLDKKSAALLDDPSDFAKFNETEANELEEIVDKVHYADS